MASLDMRRGRWSACKWQAEVWAAPLKFASICSGDGPARVASIAERLGFLKARRKSANDTFKCLKRALVSAVNLHRHMYTSSSAYSKHLQ